MVQCWCVKTQTQSLTYLAIALVKTELCFAVYVWHYVSSHYGICSLLVSDTETETGTACHWRY